VGLGHRLHLRVYVVYLGEVAGRASVFALAGMQHLPMALLAWAWAWPERSALAEVPLFTFGAIAYLAVVSTALVAVLQTMAQRVVAAPLAALVFVLEPVFAAVFAAWWLGERLGPIGWLGGGLVVVAMAGERAQDRALARAAPCDVSPARPLP
jgi:drug/metabolite transporter (DMT)-like permease